MTDAKAELTPWVVTYRNYRGDISERRIVPKSVRFGSTEWHPEPGWLLLAFDLDKQADREFALADFITRTPPPAAEVVERVARAICTVNGHDPDAFDMLLICGPNNEPLPLWKGYVEDAEAALSVMPASSAAVPEGMVLVPRSTLEWWTELARINPGDLPPRIGAMIAAAPKG